jgi:putative phosphoesterase
MHYTIGVISDTDGLLRPEAKKALKDSDLIIHAGDVGDPGLIETLSKYAPVHAVRGNMDRGIRFRQLPLSDVVEVQGCSIYVLHDMESLDLSPSSAKIDMVVSGHSHIPAWFEKDSIIYLNPGSAGPRRFSLPVTVAKVILKPGGIYPEIVHLDV